MPTITRRGDKWQAKVRRRGHATQSATFRTKAAAERWARGIESGVDDGQPTHTAEARRLTLGDALARYARDVTPKKRGSTRELQRVDAWRRHHLAGRLLVDVRASDLAAYRDARLAVGKSSNTIRLELALLSNVFTVARREWGLPGLPNPVADTAKPSTIGTARTRRLKPGEEARLLWAARRGPRWLAPLIILAIETAMRRGELVGLRDSMVDGNVASLPMTKNGQPRRVPLSPRALVALARIRKAQGGALRLPLGDGVSHAFTAAVRAAGCAGLRFHDLRREGTSRLFERGLSLPEVASITGHLTWSQLAVYTKPRAEDLAIKLAAKKSPPALTPAG
ncbi:MAG: tyrosine-type recombinase/integrase [Steroidobacteraceae bacterium]